MNKKLLKQKCGAELPYSKSPLRHVYHQSKQHLTRSACFLTIGSLVWFSGCASKPMQLLQSLSQPSSMLDFPSSEDSFSQKAGTATKAKPLSNSASTSQVANASYESPTEPRQDENQATAPPLDNQPTASATTPTPTSEPTTSEPTTSEPTTSEPTAPEPTTPTPTSAPKSLAADADAPIQEPQPAVANEPSLPANSQIPSLKMPDDPKSYGRWPITSGETPCDTGPDTDTNITLPSLALTQSTMPDLNCEPGSFAATSTTMSPPITGGSYLNGNEFRRDSRTATEIAIQLKDQNEKLKLERNYLRDTAETLKTQLISEQAARKLAETQFDELQIENKDQRKVIAQLQLAYQNLANQKIEIEKEYDTKLREIEATLDKALLEAMYDSNKKQ